MKRGGKTLVIKHYRVHGFFNPLISVGLSDFRDSLARHPDTFAYCDPPYPEVTGVYGDAPEYHEEFPHGELADILHRRDSWTLSYNNCETVKSLYPPSEFQYAYPRFKQGSRNDKGNDVIIRPKGQPPCN